VPVVDPEEPNKVEGVLRRREMMWAFKELSDEHQRLIERTNALPSEKRFETVSVELEVTTFHASICNHAIREIKVPEYSLIALLRRGTRVVVPRGFTRVEPGDILTLITTREHERGLRAWVSSGGRS
jgi:Trk K+ transport system NAD-binding subunit